MRAAVWRSLLWKECREHAWVLVGLIAVFTLVPVIAGWGEPDWASLFITFFVTIPVSALFLGVNAAAGERSRRTLAFLQALPISASRGAAAKLLVAGAVVVTPIFASAAVIAAWQGSRATPGWQVPRPLEGVGSLLGLGEIAALAILGAVAAVSLLVWVAAASVNRADEIRGAGIAIVVAAGAWSAASIVAMVIAWGAPLSVFEEAVTWFQPALPGGAPFAGLALGRAQATSELSMLAKLWFFGGPLGLGMVVHAALVCFFLRRFGRVTPGRARAVDDVLAATTREWLAPPRRSPWRAIVWKQTRETLPLAAAGMAVTLGICAVVGIAETRSREAPMSLEEWLETVCGVWAYLGFFVALVAGVGLFVEDLRPAEHTFWRSRPIPITRWFWIKFATGLIVLEAVLAAPTIVVGSAVGSVMLLAGSSFDDGFVSVPGIILAVHATAYGAAAAAMAIVRRPVVAAVLAAGVLAAVMLAFVKLEEYAGLPHWVGACVWLGGTMIVAPIVAWQAVQRIGP